MINWLELPRLDCYLDPEWLRLLHPDVILINLTHLGAIFREFLHSNFTILERYSLLRFDISSFVVVDQSLLFRVNMKEALNCLLLAVPSKLDQLQPVTN